GRRGQVAALVAAHAGEEPHLVRDPPHRAPGPDPSRERRAARPGEDLRVGLARAVRGEEPAVAGRQLVEPAPAQRRAGRALGQRERGPLQLFAGPQHARGDRGGLPGAAGHRPGRERRVAVLDGDRLDRHPSASAAIWDCTVPAPTPISWKAQRTSTVPSTPSRTVASAVNWIGMWNAVATPQPSSRLPSRIDRGRGGRSAHPNRCAPRAYAVRRLRWVNGLPLTGSRWGSLRMRSST